MDNQLSDRQKKFAGALISSLMKTGLFVNAGIHGGLIFVQPKWIFEDMADIDNYENYEDYFMVQNLPSDMTLSIGESSLQKAVQIFTDFLTVYTKGGRKILFENEVDDV